LGGDKVKFTLRFRGREIFHPDIGLKMLESMAEDLRDISVVEQKPLMEGRVLSLLLAPNAKARQTPIKPVTPVAANPTPRPAKPPKEASVPAEVSAPVPAEAALPVDASPNTTSEGE
jgi:translation initiation factor IF-3